MTTRTRLGASFAVAAVMWAASMASLFHVHYSHGAPQELGYFSSDIIFNSQARRYYSVTRNGEKIGYHSEAHVDRPGFTIYQDNTVLKLNLSGLSREVFFQTTVRVDSSDFRASYMEYAVTSGSHAYTCRGWLRADSLYLDVKNNDETPWRNGFFLVHESTTYPGIVPACLWRSPTDITSMMVFDPAVFAPYVLRGVRGEEQAIFIDRRTVAARRYDCMFEGRQCTIWIDEFGRPVRSDGDVLFSGEFGAMDMEKTTDPTLFMLPLDVTQGWGEIARWRLPAGRTIQDPRSVSYAEIEVDGIRAAQLDVGTSNRRILSSKPVIIGIQRGPLANEERSDFAMAMAAIDTSLIGTSDYIQARDARMERAARGIVTAAADTLAMARDISGWVASGMKKDDTRTIARSIDVLRERTGGCDEYTKLFTALARSIGIPTQINMGLVYDGGEFRYHSWPSVLAHGLWYDLDPYYGQETADALHVCIVRGDFERQFELMRVMNRMSMTIHEIR